MIDVAGSFAEAGLLFAFACSVVFLAGYSLIAPWWSREVGRAMVSLDVGLLLALLPTALHYMTGLNTKDVFFAWYYGASLWLVGLITLWRLVVLWRVQSAAYRTTRRTPPTP